MLDTELLDEYRVYSGKKAITHLDECKAFMENRLRKRMDRPLFIAVGAGGGQTYKTMWEVFDARFNNNTPCYFYNVNGKAINELVGSGHLPLQDWINNTNKNIRFK